MDGEDKAIRLDLLQTQKAPWNRKAAVVYPRSQEIHSDVVERGKGRLLILPIDSRTPSIDVNGSQMLAYVVQPGYKHRGINDRHGFSDSQSHVCVIVVLETPCTSPTHAPFFSCHEVRISENWNLPASTWRSPTFSVRGTRRWFDTVEEFAIEERHLSRALADMPTSNDYINDASTAVSATSVPANFLMFTYNTSGGVSSSRCLDAASGRARLDMSCLVLALGDRSCVDEEQPQRLKFEACDDMMLKHEIETFLSGMKNVVHVSGSQG
ncbi:hypothetical protein FISHEDRAFT_56636 [Fistulina hepatica ATCC 64428]|uniref:Uncharacterized protein n=1 Tax=Fistulina hepatica ATCC 64428 TaxID=1128425 RepID=A0A0D7AHY6_9AGAR|nr:hypothetical protein FISHEDRAFT_56636 [Fistulina hepatica ATCC 64428]